MVIAVLIFTMLFYKELLTLSRRRKKYLQHIWVLSEPTSNSLSPQKICKMQIRVLWKNGYSQPMEPYNMTSSFYLDTLLSYVFLKGKITNALISTTAKLKNAKMLAISTTVSKQFATGIQGVTFEPQAQLAYQHLMFDTIKDADNLTIEMQNPSQWIIPCWWTFDKNHCH